MTRADLIAGINEAHRSALKGVQKFSQSDFDTSGASGSWTAKDVFGHLAYWNWEARRAIEQVSRGQRPDSWLLENFDEVNAREWAARRSLPLPKVMDEFRRSHVALVDYLHKMDEREVGKETAYKTKSNKSANAAWIIGIVIEHYDEHREELQAWMRSRSAG